MSDAPIPEAAPAIVVPPDLPAAQVIALYGPNGKGFFEPLPFLMVSLRGVRRALADLPPSPTHTSATILADDLFKLGERLMRDAEAAGTGGLR